MPIQIAGFAKGLVLCLDFDSVSAAELEGVQEARPETLELDYAEPSATAPLIESGSAFTHLVYVQHGTVAPSLREVQRCTPRANVGGYR